MNIDFGNIASRNGTFGIGNPPVAEGEKAESRKAAGPAPRPSDLRLSDASSFDPLRGSEPVADVPASALSRDDDLGRLVASAFNLPPPPAPPFD